MCRSRCSRFRFPNALPRRVEVRRKRIWNGARHAGDTRAGAASRKSSSTRFQGPNTCARSWHRSSTRTSFPASGRGRPARSRPSPAAPPLPARRGIRIPRPREGHRLPEPPPAHREPGGPDPGNLGRHRLSRPLDAGMEVVDGRRIASFMRWTEGGGVWRCITFDGIALGGGSRINRLLLHPADFAPPSPSHPAPSPPATDAASTTGRIPRSAVPATSPVQTELLAAEPLANTDPKTASPLDAPRQGRCAPHHPPSSCLLSPWRTLMFSTEITTELGICCLVPCYPPEYDRAVSDC
jgi:hypothetical protein